MWSRAQPVRPNDLLRQFGMFFALFVCVVIIAILVAVFSRHPELRSPAAWLPYDITAETTASGIVVDVQEFQCPWSGTSVGTHLMLKSRGGTVFVHAGDTEFLRKNHVVFRRGDQIEVSGQKLSVGGHDALIARELSRGHDRFAVRDAQGKPLWLPQ